ncbi:MAG TPA: hypothetical protein VFL81_01990, partial [Candidatus Saccharimonadales bacterium]|nr:hypothetical protein [Candidatus Saccharimonadales bacterium]
VPQFDRNEIMHPRISLDDILAVQALTMGFLRWRARTRKHDPLTKRRSFGMLDSDSPMPLSEEDIYDGSTDTYLTCTVKKIHYDQWRMRVSFLTNWREEELKQANVREQFMFDWLRNGNRMAWTSTTITRVEGDTTTQDISGIKPIDNQDLDEMKARMIEHTEKVNPIEEGSFMGGQYRSGLL